jgi:hypothetical protein
MDTEGTVTESNISTGKVSVALGVRAVGHQALLRMVRGNCGRGSGGIKCLPKLMFSLGNWQGIYSRPGGQNS